MQIKVVNVGVENKGKYFAAEIVYKDERDETKTKKLMSFANPATYATLKDAKNGEAYEITQVKNDKGFWDWTSATKADGSNAGAAGTTKSFTPTKSSYETTEERARRQVLIVKQSSLSQAVASFPAASVEQILERAQTFADWVLADDKLAVEQAE
jgi:hypothetical protein